MTIMQHWCNTPRCVPQPHPASLVVTWILIACEWTLMDEHQASIWNGLLTEVGTGQNPRSKGGGMSMGGRRREGRKPGYTIWYGEFLQHKHNTVEHLQTPPKWTVSQWHGPSHTDTAFLTSQKQRSFDTSLNGHLKIIPWESVYGTFYWTK